jgi:hypothetical protein
MKDVSRMKLARIKEVPSMGAMPHYSHFKLKEQVLVRYKSGFWTIGWVIELPNAYVIGPEKLLHVYFRDPRHGRTRVFGGYGCTCTETGKIEPHCPRCHSGMRKRAMPYAPTFPNKPTMSRVKRMMLLPLKHHVKPAVTPVAAQPAPQGPAAKGNTP